MSDTLDQIISDLQSVLSRLQAMNAPDVKVQSNVNMELIDMVRSDAWPVAAPNGIICQDTESDKIERGNSIISFVLPFSLTGSKFLDFGCGDGYCVKAASDRATFAVGYDPVRSGRLPWEATDSWFLTTNLDRVRRMAPYDHIMLYDVLDHADDPVSLLKTVKEFCSPTTKIFVRCHPWCSRHGGHLYSKLNKAYVHIVLNDEELAYLDAVPDKVMNKVFMPIGTYRDYFKKAGFVVSKEDIVRTPIENFFKENALVKERIVAHWKEATDAIAREWPEHQLTQGFVDFLITL